MPTRKPKRDVYQEVTDRIGGLIERGEVTGDFLMPFATVAKEGIPHNSITGKPYQGTNVLMLWMAMIDRGFLVNEWGTYKQWKDVGLQVKKTPEDWPKNRLWGEEIVYAGDKLRKLRSDEDPNDRDVIEVRPGQYRKRYRSLSFHVVFNGEQVDGFEPTIEPNVRTDLERIEDGDDYLARTGAQIKYGGGMAAYTPHNDLIRLPRMERYEETDRYYAVAFHELGHWTGHHDRLDRRTLYSIDRAQKAREELTAEFASAFQAAKLGIEPHARHDHAEYVANWMGAIREDKTVIPNAASAARQATDYLMEVAGEPVSEEVAA